MKMKLTALALSVFMLLSMLCCFSALADAKPGFVLTADKTEFNIGDTVTLTLSVENGTGLSCGDLAFEYNKNCLEFVDASQTQAATDAGVSWVFPTADDPGSTPQAIVKFSFIHMTEIDEKDANLAHLVFTFKAVGGGTCKFPLQTTGVEIAVDGADTKEVSADLSSNEISISGDAAPAWDYSYTMSEVSTGDTVADSSREKRRL